MTRKGVLAEARRFFSREEIQNFQNAFNAFDEDGDERNPLPVLGKLLRAVNYLPREEEIEDMVEEIAPYSDQITFEDFLGFAYYHARYVDPRKELFNAFRLFDRKETGILPAELLNKILRSFKHRLSETEIEELLGVADISEGDVEYKDFVEKLLNF
jgi:Ca2+-binding EF-hand superfamily protein